MYVQLQAQLAGATAQADRWYPLTRDASGALVVSTGGGGIVRVEGAVTPTDNFANPTNAVPAASFTMGYDGANWDRVRVRPWTSTPGTQTASVAAFDVIAQLCGSNGLGGISDVAVTASNQMRVSFAPNGPIVNVDNSNFTNAVSEYVGTINYVRTQTTLPATYTDARWTSPSADAYAQTFVVGGRPANNTRNLPSNIVQTGGGDRTVSNAPCVLRWLDVTNLDTGTAIVFVQLHNTAGAIGAGATAVLSFPLGPGGVGSTVTNLQARMRECFADVSGGGGLYFSTGLHIGISSTAGTYTAVGTVCQVNATTYS